MLWNVDLDICSLVILITIIVLNCIKGYVPIRRTRVFLCLVVSEMIALSCNILLKFLWINPDLHDWIGMDVLINMHFIFEYAVSIIFLYYMIVWSGKNLRIDRIALVFVLIPTVVYLYLIIKNCITHNFYFFDEKYVYIETSDTSFMNIVIFYCMLFGVIYAIIYVKNISYGKLTLVAILDLFTGLAYVLQFYILEIYFIDFVLAFSIFLIYMVLQNPFEMIDEKTQVLNRNMLEELSEIDIRNDCDFDVIVLAMDDFKFINKTFGIHVGDMMLRQVAYYLTTLTKKGRVYRYGADMFALQIRKKQNNTEEVLKQIKRRFTHPWITEDVAEGVETDEQQLHLSQIGCDYLQGWYYSKAIPEAEFINLIRKVS